MSKTAGRGIKAAVSLAFSFAIGSSVLFVFLVYAVVEDQGEEGEEDS